MTTGERIKILREQKGMTLEELGEKVGVGKSTVRKWENGMIANMRRDKIAKLASALNVDPLYLMGWDSNVSNASIEPVTNHRYALVYGHVAAGEPLEMNEDIIGRITIDEMPKDGTYMSLQIEGHSMEPDIKDKDIVVVRQQPDIESGEIGIVAVNGNYATCKRLMKYKDGIRLVPINPSYEPLYFSNADIENLPVTILGKVMEVRHKYY